MQKTPAYCFWRGLELADSISRTYSPRIWEARRDIAVRVLANAARMGSASRFDPARLPQ